MKPVLVLGLLFALTACVQPSNKPEATVDLSDQLSPGCYTVDLFDPYRLEHPGASVPAEARKFLGVWQNGAWGGDWCHDLYVTEIRPDGSVVVLDAYGPSQARGHEASVYRRVGQIQNGVLSFLSHGKTPVSYRLQGDFLVGQRKGFRGHLDIVMSRTDRIAEIPVPPRKPRRS